MAESVGRNEVKIAGREIRVYIGECAFLFQKYDQIILSSGEKYLDKMKYIADILKALGVEIESDYKNPKHNDKCVYKKEEVELVNERTGRREVKTFYKLGLTKIPDLFMFTNPKKAIELDKIK